MKLTKVIAISTALLAGSAFAALANDNVANPGAQVGSHASGIGSNGNAMGDANPGEGRSAASPRTASPASAAGANAPTSRVVRPVPIAPSAR